MPNLDPSEDLTVELWHGAGRSWDGFPEVRNSRPKAYEYGPGIYMTTHLETAQKYARGGGSLIAMTLRNPRLMGDETVPLDEALEFVATCPDLRKRPAIAAGLRRVAPRFGGRVKLDHLVVQCVNNDALSGAAGPAVAAWIVAHGVDACVVSRSGQEDWLVVFNPAIIAAHRKVPAHSLDVATADRAQVHAQLEQARQRLEHAALTAEACAHTQPVPQPGVPQVRRAVP